MIAFAAAMLFLRARKCVSLESLFDKIVLFMKLGTLTLLVMCDWHYAIPYAIALAGIICLPSCVTLRRFGSHNGANSAQQVPKRR